MRRRIDRAKDEQEMRRWKREILDGKMKKKMIPHGLSEGHLTACHRGYGLKFAYRDVQASPARHTAVTLSNTAFLPSTRDLRYFISIYRPSHSGPCSWQSDVPGIIPAARLWCEGRPLKPVGLSNIPDNSFLFSEAPANEAFLIEASSKGRLKKSIQDEELLKERAETSIRGCDRRFLGDTRQHDTAQSFEVPVDPF